MDRQPHREPGPSKKKSVNWTPAWFKWALVVLLALVVTRLLGWQVFFEITYDGEPFLAALTDVKTYFVPLILILVYILLSWIWKKLFKSKEP